MSIFIESVQKIILRDLDKLEKEIASYPDRNALWMVRGDIKNPAGNLCLHLCGNLQHFIGAILGQSGYVRDREKEFSIKGLSAAVTGIPRAHSPSPSAGPPSPWCDSTHRHVWSAGGAGRTCGLCRVRRSVVVAGRSSADALTGFDLDRAIATGHAGGLVGVARPSGG